MFYEVKFNIVVVIVVFAYPVSRMRRSVPKEIKEDNTAALNFLQANHVLVRTLSVTPLRPCYALSKIIEHFGLFFS